MIELVVLLLLIFALAAGIAMYKSLSKSKDISYYETQIASEFAARAHRLITDGVKIDQMPYSYDKHQMHTDWVDSLHLYMDDYEAAVANKIPKNSDIKAYAGIRLVVSEKQSSE